MMAASTIFASPEQIIGAQSQAEAHLRATLDLHDRNLSGFQLAVARSEASSPSPQASSALALE